MSLLVQVSKDCQGTAKENTTPSRLAAPISTTDPMAFFVFLDNHDQLHGLITINPRRENMLYRRCRVLNPQLQQAPRSWFVLRHLNASFMMEITISKSMVNSRVRLKNKIWVDS
ncbi:hypothetical protein COCSADRAFT_330304 [Bipolaris sorokiniana ND90Pr]|uniref:Uncharacterized protein n=1 Tax=Cochliobolus sativus (strain ND90Pr / ATCC 201652) TaxID=665912 RepID=M2SMY9_COCSN|nr:uncharacterized protein COCSADRAFT_330304 [Bipolaris sorokiniana ND90Pr]EMD63665.1 hypothetical protein COCSADRAFT_330304 [Bipolaris sorokiniana ND90Pr]